MEDDKNRAAGHTFLAKLGKTRLRPGGRKATEWLLSKSGIAAESQVLEVACNMGTTAMEVASRFGCHLIGVDRDRDALEKACKNVAASGLAHLIEIREANAFELPFPDASFDVVINEAMLTMFPDESKLELLSEYARVLKPGGRFLSHDVMLTDDAPADLAEGMRKTINVNARPLTKSGWVALFGQVFSKVETDNGPMTLMSPCGMVRDEGLVGALRIFKNGMKAENRPMFGDMFKRFRANRAFINYLASCSLK